MTDSENAMPDELKSALRTVLRECPSSGYGEYAKAYARAALLHPITGEPMRGVELRTQVLYVLSNLTYWRGENARRIKMTLKKHTK